MDRISNLPSGIIETVLSLLPIEEAVRTSILSKEWRYRWIKIPKLAFIEDAFKGPTDGAKTCKLFHAVNQVLLMHQGPIHEFTLRMKVDGSCVEIDHMLLHLSKTNTVKILKLDFFGTYTLPLSLFSFTELTELYIDYCRLDHEPSSFSGFGSLTTLYLHEIEIYEKTLLHLLSSCSLLKRLAIMIGGVHIESSGDSTIADLFKCLPNIEYLLPKKLPTTLVHLKYLHMDNLCFSHVDSFPFLAVLIRSSPNLEKLKLEILDEELFDETGSFTLEDYSDIMLEHLNELEILCFGNLENELVFVQLMLAISPVLKNVRILVLDKFDEDEKLEISESLLSSPCASHLVKIIVS